MHPKVKWIRWPGVQQIDEFTGCSPMEKVGNMPIILLPWTLVFSSIELWSQGEDGGWDGSAEVVLECLPGGRAGDIDACALRAHHDAFEVVESNPNVIARAAEVFAKETLEKAAVRVPEDDAVAPLEFFEQTCRVGVVAIEVLNILQSSR